MEVEKEQNETAFPGAEVVAQVKRQARLLLDGVAAGWWIEEVLEAQRRVVLAPLLLPLRPRDREECDREIRSSLEERDRIRKSVEERRWKERAL